MIAHIYQRAKYVVLCEIIPETSPWTLGDARSLRRIVGGIRRDRTRDRRVDKVTREYSFCVVANRLNKSRHFYMRVKCVAISKAIRCFLLIFLSRVV